MGVVELAMGGGAVGVVELVVEAEGVSIVDLVLMWVGKDWIATRPPVTSQRNPLTLMSRHVYVTHSDDMPKLKIGEHQLLIWEDATHRVVVLTSVAHPSARCRAWSCQWALPMLRRQS